MESHHFEDLIRSLSGTRRSVLGGALAAATGWLGASGVNAKKKRKHKKREPKAKPNAFGCLEVGDPCKSEAQCCSGVCEGKKGKKQCRAHDVADCTAATQPADCGDAAIACTTSAGAQACAAPRPAMPGIAG